jgi:hypothetical protein
MIFIRFSTNFTRFRKSRRDGFTNRPSNFAVRPSGQKFRLQLGPWHHDRRWELNFGEGKPRLDRERAGECSGAHLRPIPGFGRLQGHAGAGARRHQPLVAAATGLLANRTLDLEHKRLGELWGCSREATGGCLGDGVVRKGELAMRPPMAAGGGVCVVAVHSSRGDTLPRLNRRCGRP